MTLVLASNSASRRAMLEAAGIEFRSEPAGIDERQIEARLGEALAPQIALALAAAKALAISTTEELVLGSDSLVVVDGRRFDKPANRTEAAEHLRAFSGQTMELHAAAALARSSRIVWSGSSVARLQVRELSPDFIASYLDAEWPAVAGCVGVFRIEARGVQLFSAIDGDHFTVLGMPLIDVLGALRELGELQA